MLQRKRRESESEGHTREKKRRVYLHLQSSFAQKTFYSLIDFYFYYYMIIFSHLCRLSLIINNMLR
jgi:hypothetical protein